MICYKLILPKLSARRRGGISVIAVISYQNSKYLRFSPLIIVLNIYSMGELS